MELHVGVHSLLQVIKAVWLRLDQDIEVKH